MVTRKNNPDYVKNPLTKNQSYIKKDSKTYKLVFHLLQKYNNNIERARKEYLTLTTRIKPQYNDVKTTDFCGEVCDYKPKSFPVNTQKRCRAALSYARYASNPDCIRKCALDKAKEYGFKCGISSKKIK